MTPRPRKQKNRNLPPNLYPDNGGKSFRYRHPKTGQFFGMGSDKAKAVADAKQLNSLLMDESNTVQRVIGSKTVAQFIGEFFESIIPEREYAPSTVEMYRVQSKKLREAVGNSAIEDVVVSDIADIMKAASPRTANQFRQVAVDIFNEAVAQGLCSMNPAEITRKRKEKRRRGRLTFEAYLGIRSQCEPWMRNAMDLALITLQRRSDIARMRFDWEREGRLYVVQQKTQKHDTGYLSIKITPQLAEIIKRCRDDVASPFMVHRKPQRKIKSRDAEHWTQVMPQMLSRAFAEARDKTDLFAGLDDAEKPTFHEIRALGIKLYRDQGKNPQWLAGHAEIAMTNNYDSDHRDIRWVEVDADLDIGFA